MAQVHPSCHADATDTTNPSAAHGEPRPSHDTLAVDNLYALFTFLFRPCMMLRFLYPLTMAPRLGLVGDLFGTPRPTS
jgi:hypothetical protein